MGRFNAREELIRLLGKGIEGDYDPVTATSVWNSIEQPYDVPAGEEAGYKEPSQSDDDDTVEEGFFLDIMAKAEEHQEDLAPALEQVGKCVVELGELADKSTDQLRRSDAAGKGMRGRLQVITSYAASVDAVAGRLDVAVNHYMSVLKPFSAGMIALIQKMENDSDALDEGRDFGMQARQAASVTRDCVKSLAGLIESIESNAKASRVLRAPSLKLAAALDQFIETTSDIDEWDRRLQALGIPMPSDDWKPDSGEHDSEDGEPTDAANSNDYVVEVAQPTNSDDGTA